MSVLGVRRLHRQRGQGTVEFTLVAMALFAIIFGIVEGGRLMFTLHEVNHAAREGARYAAAQGFFSGGVMSAVEIEDQVQAVTSGLDWNRLTLTADWPGDANIAHCSETPNRDGCPVIVAISYEYQPIVAMIIGSGSLTLNADSTMRIHY
jgi:Flp pilus assembly protein TadG